jgi:hypothetical protein
MRGHAQEWSKKPGKGTFLGPWSLPYEMKGWHPKISMEYFRKSECFFFINSSGRENT